jgi:hypothetical protein
MMRALAPGLFANLQRLYNAPTPLWGGLEVPEV